MNDPLHIHDNPVPTDLAVEPCQRQSLLADQLRAAMDEIVALEAAIITGASASKDELKKARERKDSIWIEYERHVRIHGCQTMDAA